MGEYINHTSGGHPLPGQGKADALLADGATEIPLANLAFQPFLVCVVENPSFDAAGFAYTAEEYMAFKMDKSPRRRRWFVAEGAVTASAHDWAIKEMWQQLKVYPVPEQVFVVRHRSREEMEREFKEQFPGAVFFSLDDEE